MDSSDQGEIIQTTRIGFKQFDVVPEASDHHYISKKYFDEGNSSLYAHIMKEWKILKKSLPETIYVQVYETRIDLLRAVIIGPPETPYQDGLFFFDIRLPSDYPKCPPKVYYRSHGYRLNPNLYASGKVCLSLINTWSGSKDEKWRQESTILQLLVSIQGLVLNNKPYFNEPGYEYGKNSASPKWIKPSNTYNENIFIFSCWSMLHLMRKPPKKFEGFVAQHFRERANSILAAIKSYQEGHIPVWLFLMTTRGSSVSSEIKVSEKFKAHLATTELYLKGSFERLTTGPAMEKHPGSLKECGNASGSSPKTGKNGTKGRNGKWTPKNVRKHKNWFVKQLFSCLKVFGG